MEEEMLSLTRNQTWRLVDRSKDQKMIGWKWVFKRKPGTPGVEEAMFKKIGCQGLLTDRSNRLP